MDERTTLSQSPACRIAVERARALERGCVAEANRASKEVSSMARERECWKGGTSMSWMDSQSGLPAALAKDWRE